MPKITNLFNKLTTRHQQAKDLQAKLEALTDYTLIDRLSLK